VNRALVVAAALMLMCGRLVAQTADTSTGGDNLDNLFNGDNSGSSGTQGTDQSGTPAQPPVTPQPRPDDLTLDDKVHFLSDLSIYGLAGVGWADENDLSINSLAGEGSGSLSANLGIDFRPAPQLRVRGTLSYTFPTAGTQLSQLIVDYSIKEAVFFRLGIFDYSWSNSQFFQFANLPARGLPTWSGVINVPLWQQLNILSPSVVANYPASVRMYIPFGVNGITLLSRFDMANYDFPGKPDHPTPDPRNAGYGVQLDLVTGPIQWTLGGFTQELLYPRSSLGMKTSLLGFDLSLETTVAYPVHLMTSDPVQFFQVVSTTGGGWFVGGQLQRIYPTATVGLFREWQDPHIRLYAEYGYNAERDPHLLPNGDKDLSTTWLDDETGPGGHNSVVALRFSNLMSTDISLNALWQHNWSDGSGLLSAFMEVSPVPLTTIQLGPVFLYGPKNGEVAGNRLVPGSKRLEFLVLVKVSDSFRQ
jgi:hypothetical protein